MSAENLTSYLNRPYRIEIVQSKNDDGDAGWVAEVKELRGCIAQGRSREELLDNIDRAMEAWIDDALEAGDPIPAPR